MPLRLLIDECLSPALVNVAYQHGFQAHHVVYRGWESRSDAYLRAQLLEGEFTFVTDNWRDFRCWSRPASMPVQSFCRTLSVRMQVRLFDVALRAALLLANPADLMNTVLEVDADGTVRVYDLPDTESSS